MADDFVASDTTVLDLLRVGQSMTVTELAESLQVTGTAVRQRLNRLLAQKYVERTAVNAGRGRPSHQYRLTDEGRRKAGSNLVDLGAALWEEVRRIQDPELRQGLLQRLAKRLALMYADSVHGETVEERMRALAAAFTKRQIPLTVECNGSSPTLIASCCPYPGLSDGERTICALERMFYSAVLGENMQQVQSRQDGANCCVFRSN